MNINRSLLVEVLNECLESFPPEEVPGLNSHTIQQTIIPSLIEQANSLQGLPIDDQIIILLASIGKLSMDNFALNYKLSQKIYK